MGLKVRPATRNGLGNLTANNDKIMHLKNWQATGQGRQGFTLIEIIGVVAVIAILAAVLTPRVINVIARGKVAATAQSLGSLKSSTADYLAKNGSIPARSGTGATNSAVTTGRFDADLVAGGFLEKLFACSIGTQTFDASALTGRTHVRTLTAASAASVTAPTATVGGDNFDLDRDGSTADFTTGQTVVAAFIPGASLTDAIALNKILDGDQNTGTSADTTGRCMYSAAAVDNTVTIYIYIAHY
jgi:prepilin-type N-terminal cleavage/methylation domain-containing protein